MKIFHFTADCTFEAENLEAAFEHLWRHFKGLAKGEDYDEDAFAQMTGGKIELEPLKSDK